MRDPDGYIYFKEEVGGLLMGGFEPEATPWLQSARHRAAFPRTSSSSCCPTTGTQFQILMDNAILRVPALETAQVKQFNNGPESFTRGQQLHPGRGAGAARTSSSAPASTRWASRRRAAPARRSPNGSCRASRRSTCGRSTSAASRASTATIAGCRTASARCSACTTRCRGRTASSTARGRSAARRSTRTCATRGACFGSKMGWERANFFAPSPAEAQDRVRLGPPELASVGRPASTAPAASASRCST